MLCVFVCVYVCVCVCVYVCVHVTLHMYLWLLHTTVFYICHWTLKIDQIVTPGLFPFTVPANGCNYALSIHGAITRLS